VLVGHVARVDAVKDHLTSLRAFAYLAAARSDVHLVLCGAGTDDPAGELARWISDTGAADRVHPLGRRADLPVVQAAFDVAVSTSVSEGLSNALGEAMSCGVPCVSTEAGDAAELLGSSGVVVPVGDAEALAAGIERVLSDRAHLGAMARERVETHFSLQRAVQNYADVLLDVAHGG
jgi:glycosyltransferase involved in cell wall biosynthesis